MANTQTNLELIEICRKKSNALRITMESIARNSDFEHPVSSLAFISALMSQMDNSTSTILDVLAKANNKA